MKLAIFVGILLALAGAALCCTPGEMRGTTGCVNYFVCSEHGTLDSHQCPAGTAWKNPCVKST